MMYDIDKLSDDDVMKEVWQNKAAVSAEFGSLANYPAYSKKIREKYEALGWHYSSPQEQNGEKAASPQSI
jgi:hypothetical protein